MNSLSKIIFILTASAVLGACAKDELEAPESNAIPNALIDNTGAANHEIDAFTYTGGVDAPQALDVNDDGDDESAGSNPDTEKKK